jgi:hypothetical protein
VPKTVQGLDGPLSWSPWLELPVTSSTFGLKPKSRAYSIAGSSYNAPFGQAGLFPFPSSYTPAGAELPRMINITGPDQSPSSSLIGHGILAPIVV